MPWKEVNIVQQRNAFIDAHLSGAFRMGELCRRFGVSRVTGYKWLARYDAHGRPGLADQSRARHTQGHRVPDKVIAAILGLKIRHADWGPVTIRSALHRQDPQGPWPATSTVGAILKRHGMVRPRKAPRRKTPPCTQPLAHAAAANEVWSIDFKSHFAMGDTRRCHPLTITDNASRMLLACKGLDGPRLDPSVKVLSEVFAQYGLPAAIRSDNGWPFANTGLGGLTPLSVWFIRLGVYPERIEPGHPEQNGRHERMHRALKAACCKPPKANMSAQQRAFNRFRREYNEERPHQALGLGVCPTDRYTVSPRAYPERLPETTYPDDYLVRKVRQNGEIKLHGNTIYATQQLVGQPVGLQALDHDRWQLYFGMVKLGVVDERLGRVIRPT